MISLDGTQRRILVDSLAQIDILQTVEGCISVLRNAGLGALIPRIKFTGPIRLAIGNLVDFLAHWGTVEGQEALDLFLFALLNEVGEDMQVNLESLIDQLHSKQKNLPGISSVRSPTPPEEIPEKLIGEPTLLPLSFLERALELARAIAYIEVGTQMGTGFMVSPKLLITNHHVLPEAASASQAIFRFNYQQNLQGDIGPVKNYSREEEFFYTSEELDYTIVELQDNPGTHWGFIPMRLRQNVQIDDRVNIIQHPGGRPKQISFRNNFVEYADQKVVQYVTHTEPGSSGSPVFSDRWELIALHHAGGLIREPLTQRRYYRNEGITIQAILESLPIFVKSLLNAN